VENMSTALINSLSVLGRAITAKAETIIFSRGDKAATIYLLLSGRIYINTSSETGRELGFAILQPGEVFGLNAIIASRLYEVEALTVTECQLIAIDRKNLEDALLDDAPLGYELVKHLIWRLNVKRNSFEDLTMHSFPSRLAKLLLGAAAEHVGTSNSLVSINLSQKMIASLAGVSREAVNRQLHKWAQSAIIEHKGKYIRVLDQTLLQRISEGHDITSI
jgi:CRP/FNR family cyclic AMP-dependent transcriptional regulator